MEPLEARLESSFAGVATAEWDSLTTALNRWGVLHVAPAESRPAAVPLAPQELFAGLLRANEPRLHQAFVVLLLTHPRLASDARAAIEQFDGVQRDRAMRRYVAASALQRMARTRIALRLGTQPMVPPAYLDELGLPPLDEEFGRMTLWVLASQERERYGYDAWGTYRAILNLFLSEIRRRNWGKGCGNEPTRHA